MINQAAEVIHLKISTPDINDQQAEKSPTGSKRVLPSVPVGKGDKLFSKSDNDLSSIKLNQRRESEAIMDKFKYNSLQKKKKDKKLRTSSQFYVKNTDLELPPKFEIQDGIKQVIKGTPNEYNGMPDGQTHVALYKFYARHKDELQFLDGDPIQVLKVFDDLWYEGVNLLTGKQGFFPCRYVADILLKETPTAPEAKEEDYKQFHMRFLGSVEVADYKGEELLIFAIAKMVNQRSMLSSAEPPTCILQLSIKGIRISNIHYSPVEKQAATALTRKVKKGKKVENNGSEEEQSHFFSLKNVTFCGNHPKDHRYFAFITKHPSDHRFACHIFMSKYSTDPVCKVIGSCFQKFYETYLEYRAPTEDIYIE